MIAMRLVSSLEKAFTTDLPEAHSVLREISVLRGERLHMQLLLREDGQAVRPRRLRLTVSGMPCPVTIRAVAHVPADFPTYYNDTSRGTDCYLPSPTGLYPDVLEPLDEGQFFYLPSGRLQTLWLECTPESPGRFDPTVTAEENGTILGQTRASVTVVAARLPEQRLIFTQWFHCDCLASYYNVPVFSEEHWRIVKNFMVCAVRNGVNCILTPILTPPLDTEKGRERPTTQLVTVYLQDGHYTFDFSRLDRWIDLARDCGIRYFEISHLFSQWGAEFAPKVVACTPEGLRRIFGWDTPGTEGEYPRFLEKLLPELVRFLRSKGVLESCRFHISDEPEACQLAGYRKAKALVAPYLRGCVTIDALSDVAFYRAGAVEIPIPAIDRIGPFLEEDIPERWAYYCCAQWDRVSNRFLAYPAFRNRILGVQLYKFGIRGFLHWGFNFYYSMGSRRLLNPYLCQSGEGQVPCGDAFSAYPGPDGTPLESTRLAVFYEAIQDMAALELAETLVGRETVIDRIDSLAGAPVTFTQYPATPDYLLTLRREINWLIAAR